MTLPAISKHLKVLEHAGLISRSRDAQRRHCQVAAAPMREAVRWMERYRRFWGERLDGLDDYLREMKKKERKRDG